MSQDSLLTAKQLSVYLQVTRRTLTNWVNQGMPSKRLAGRLLRFDVAACLEWHRKQQEIKARTNGLHEKRTKTQEVSTMHEEEA